MPVVLAVMLSVYKFDNATKLPLKLAVLPDISKLTVKFAATFT